MVSGPAFSMSATNALTLSRALSAVTRSSIKGLFLGFKRYSTSLVQAEFMRLKINPNSRQLFTSIRHDREPAGLYRASHRFCNWCTSLSLGAWGTVPEGSMRATTCNHWTGCNRLPGQRQCRQSIFKCEVVTRDTSNIRGWALLKRKQAAYNKFES